MENKTQKGHPAGLYLLFTTEMWERFSYYGMRAIFTLYMIQALAFNKDVASGIYGSYTGLVYLTPIIGGYFADNIWGNRKSIFWGGFMMAVGQFFMFLSAWNYTNTNMAMVFMVTGLTFLIFGNGFFKPNISTMVGQLYEDTDSRKDAAYTIFYMGINLGAFFAPLVTGFLGDTGNPGDFKWGFLAACIGMIIAIFVFEALKNKYLVSPTGEPIGIEPNTKRLAVEINHEPGDDVLDDTVANRERSAKVVIDPTPVIKGNKKANNVMIGAMIGIALLFILKFFVFAGASTGISDGMLSLIASTNEWISAIIFAATIAVPAIIYLDPSLTTIEKQRITVIFIIAFFVIFFWAAFEQAGASLTFFADEQTNREVFGWTMPASYFSSFNAIFIVILAPVISILWAVLAKRKMEPASPVKQAFGLFFLSLGYLVIAFGVKDVDPNVKVSMFWLTSLYLLHTIGELFLSPIGLSMVNKLSPVRFASLLMGVWFLSTAAANNFAGVLSGFYPEEGKAKSFVGFQIADMFDFFMLFVVLSGAASLILFILSKYLVKLMHGVR
jgi:proton-dependent oligopeptide transporter, POT family